MTLLMHPLSGALRYVKYTIDYNGVMVLHYVLSDKNVVGLLLLLRSKKEIATSNMSEINQYGSVKTCLLYTSDAADERSGSSGRKNKLIWKLTPEGLRIADSLFIAETGLTLAFR